MFQPNIIKFNASARFRGIFNSSICYYSRKSSSDQSGAFKIISKARDGDDFMNSKLHHNENWELFGHNGFRFYMPGCVGPAWHDTITTSFIPSTLPSKDHMELECVIQDCPLLLRSGVEELFQSADTSSTPLTIVTLVQRGAKPKNDTDFERQTKEFMWAAQEICGKLRAAGYWADFINPFSGHPFYSSSLPDLYKTDQRFRCHGFQVTSRGQCRVITPSSSQKFIGSLFTTAPSSTDQLKDILKMYETIDIYPK